MGGAKKLARKATNTVAKTPGGKMLQRFSPVGAAVKAYGEGRDPVAAAADPGNYLGLNPGLAPKMVSTAGRMPGGMAAGGMGGNETIRNPDGTVKDVYKMDPTKSAGFNKLNEQAMAAPGSSPWAQMQMQKQGLEEAGQMEGAGRASQTALAQSQGQLMRTGGLSSGARTRMAMQATRDQSRDQQNVARQGMLSRLGIQDQDMGRQQDALSKISGTELNAQEKNIGLAAGDLQSQRDIDLEKYRKQMEMWGAAKTADAQVNAAGRGGGGKK